MRKIDKDGLILCNIQAQAFEKSLEFTSVSSQIFIRRFMNSKVSLLMDDSDFLQTNMQAKDIIDRIDEEYGVSEYGSLKYSREEMYWIGYIYRYYAYTYEMSSVQVYRVIKPKELRSYYLPYHTMDPSQAIERILEAKGLILDEEAEFQRQFMIFKKIRKRGI